MSVGATLENFMFRSLYNVSRGNYALDSNKKSYLIAEIYDKLCELFDTPIDSYVSTCDILGGPFGLDLTMCADSNDPCDVRISSFSLILNIFLLFLSYPYASFNIEYQV